jgi:hypothetical protein
MIKMKNYYSIILTALITLITPTLTFAQETLYLEEAPPPQNNSFFSNSTQVTYEGEAMITQTFYKTVEPALALIYTRGACENVNLINQLETLHIPYTCRSIDQTEQYRELVALLYDIGIAGSIPLPVVYYQHKVLLDPNLDHIKILTPISSNH